MAVEDGLYMPTIKPHTLEKIRRHNCAAGMFARGMSKKWPQRAYLGLYSGAGLARVEGTGEIVETTALSVLREPFTHFVFVDSDPTCIAALEERIAALPAKRQVSFILGDVNDRVADIQRVLPKFSKKNGLLSFCFLDPFDAGLHFSTIRALASFQMDFLILLALGHDVRRNFWRHYYLDHSNTRIADLIGCPGWRDEFERGSQRNIVRFVLRKFDEAMVSVGYQSPKPHHHHAIKVGGVLLYYLVLYSKHPLGQSFWETTLSGMTTQTELELPL